MTSNKKIFLSLITPLFNEEETVIPFIESINNIFSNLRELSLEVIFIDDGSQDNTLNILLNAQKFDKKIKIIEFSRNFGKEAALTAGLKLAKGNIVVPIDVDLQDPPELIPKMIEIWKTGYDVVLAKRVNRDSDSWLKKNTASLFYFFHNKISNQKIPSHVGDFRLLDRLVVNAINQLPENRRFMKGIFAWAGFKTSLIEYKREKRIAGKTKFSGWKLWNFALEGFTSFSTVPLRMWTYIGLLVASSSFFYAIFIILKVIFYGVDVPGYASIFVAITFLNGINLIGIGILGEYIGRTYIESKNRPIYLIRSFHKSE